MQLDPGLLARARRPGKEAMWVEQDGQMSKDEMRWRGDGSGEAKMLGGAPRRVTWEMVVLSAL